MVESKFYKDNKSSKSNLFKNIVLRVLITIIVTLILLIGFKMNSNFKKTFYHYVYEENFKELSKIKREAIYIIALLIFASVVISIII